MVSFDSDAVLLIFWGVAILNFYEILRYILALITHGIEYSGVDVV